MSDQPPVAPVPAAPVPAVPPYQPLESRRKIGDVATTRKLIYENIRRAAQAIEPVVNSRHTLSLHAVDYEGAEDFPLKVQKEHILSGKTLARRLRGTWRLTDNATGNVLDEKRTTLANVPHLTQRGTYVLNGTEYSFAHQLRLRPGVYARRKANGELESHVATKGKGTGHHLYLDPESGVFRMHIGQANIPLLPILRAAGASDQDIQDAWGVDLWAANKKHDSAHHVAKLYERLVRKGDPNSDPEQKTQALRTALEALELDPEITKRTLGKPYANYGKDAILSATKKLLSLNRGETAPDDRDHLAYQTVVGPEDFLAERIGRDKGTLQKLLWQASFRGSLKNVQPGAFNKALTASFLNSGLAQSPEGISAAEFIDHGGRITKMGQGGFGLGSEGIPAESRNLHSSQFGFIDITKTPESGSTGVDLRLAYGVQKGSDGRLYAPFRDVKSNKLIYRSPQQLTDLTVAFPGELTSGRRHVAAIVDGRLTHVPREKVDLESPSMENAFSPLSNLVPMKSAAKGQRVSMGARYIAQSLPLLNAEAPHVRSAVPGQPGKSYEELYGRHMGAVHADQAGKVEKVTPDEIVVHYADGTKKTHELYSGWASSRKTGVDSTPAVAPGDRVEPGQLLAKSNYTDDKGHAATGLNTRVAYVPFLGKSFEDAAVISESYAKRMTSDHFYQHRVEFDDAAKTGKKNYLHLFPGKYTLKELEHLDDHGVAKPGSVVQPGAPLVLQARHRDLDYGKVTQSARAAFADATTTWDHHNPGIVTDVVRGKDGVNVVVRSYAPMQIGDKLCYDAATELLTRHGWKKVYRVSVHDEVACLVDGKLVYQLPTQVYAYPEGGRMYRARGHDIDLLVTESHNLYVRAPEGATFRLVPASLAAGTGSVHRKAAPFVGTEPQAITIPGSTWASGIGWTQSRDVPAEAYLRLLAAVLRYGRVRRSSGCASGQLLFDVRDDVRRAEVCAALTDAGIPYAVDKSRHYRLRVRPKLVVEHFHAILEAGCIPERISGYSPRLLQTFVTAMFGGGKRRVCKTRELAEDLQRICLHAGIAADVRTNVFSTLRRGNYHVPELVKEYEVRLRSGETTPRVESWVEGYEKPVFCVEVPGNVLLVRRRGKAVFCGNSQRWGGKATIADIVPDEHMPHDEQNRPFEMAVSPLGLLSRVNPAWVVEAALGKIAERTGKPYHIEDFGNITNLTEFALKELEKHGLSDTETITDPRTGRKIPGVLAGNNYILKLHHTADSKSQGRGLGGYSADGSPTKGGDGGAKRLSIGDSNALISHGALEVLRDSREHRGQQDNEFWLSYMAGFPTPHAKVPKIYEKFLTQLKGAGINVVREGPRLRLMALTNRDVDELAGSRELQNAETVKFDKNLEPIKGGLFDPALTGAHGGKSWAKISLTEPMPSPAFADPIKKLLGLTGQRYLDILAGKEELQGRRGPEALYHALEELSVPKELERTRREISSSRKGVRDAAVKRLSYLKSLEKTGLHPKDWFLSAVPVLPPMFRPVSLMAGGRGQLVSDPNMLYKELFEANQNLKHLKGTVGDLSEERLGLYRAFEGVVGLGDPVTPKNQERGVKGLLRSVLGSSPKHSLIHQKLLGTTVDLAGRAVISPGPDMDMDHIGLPEDKAFEVYQPFVVRHLVRSGMPRVQALRAVVDREEPARKALVQIMGERPVLVNRYPLLHRYGLMAFYPRLEKGDVIRLSPLVYKGFGADNDGDAMQFHVPVSDEAVRDAHEKMLPSKNLYSAATFKVHQMPNAEYMPGLHAASVASDEGRPRIFATRADALRAYRRGEIGLGQKVELMKPE